MKKWHPGLSILPGDTPEEQKEHLFDYMVFNKNTTYLKKTDMLSVNALPKWIEELRKDNNNDTKIS